MKGKLNELANQGAAKLRIAKTRLVGAIEKGFERAKLSRVQVSSNLDLSAIPNYVAYRAALVREKMLLQHICVGLGIVLIATFVLSRIEVSNLSERLRMKEYILAPGVSDFIPVAPQSVPDAYVQHAVSDFVATLGNTNPTNIEERYQQLSSMMSPALQVQFIAEANDWIAKVRAENISEMLTILNKRIEADGKGSYRATVNVRTDAFIGSEAIGYRNEMIEMHLRLTPPDAGRRWYLEMIALTRHSADAASAAKSLGGSK
ncbi:MAG: hypothetical protein AB7T49_19880 [Oligoflexales bacterium]